jgi:outer membrane protein assembly factor BamB
MMQELQPEDPRQMGSYRLLRRLGAGGMGQVYLGLSPGGRPVAVKVIHAQLAAEPDFRVRFRREVAAARKVSGVFTAAVVDADLDSPTLWLATAYVDGPSLSEAVHEHGPLPPGAVLALAAGLAEGLAAIHAAGVVHRDLKPLNVLLAGDGPRIIDFGISRAAEMTWLTGAGSVVGSPGFMSPEQAEGHDVGTSSDIFSLGTVLAFAATGEGPFGAGSSDALLYRVVHTQADLDRVPDEVRPLVERCLAKEPGDRPTAADILAEAGVVHPVPGWLPESVLRAYTRDPVSPEAVEPGATGDIPIAREPTLGSAPGGGQAAMPARSSPAPRQVIGQVRAEGGDQPRRRRRPLILSGIIAALVVAAVLLSVALAGTTPRTAARAHISARPPSVSARPPSAKRGWVFAVPTSVDGTPAVADGVVYVGDDNGNIYALTAASGTLRWKLSTGSSVVSRPAVVDGTVYIGSENNDVYALDAVTGAIRWKRDTGGSVDSGPAVTGGLVYVGNDNNEVFALDAATGAIRWTQQTGDNVTTNPAVSGGTVYVGCEDDSVYALDAATGAVRWQRPTRGQVNSSPAVSGRTIFVGSDDGSVYALDAATGAVEWTRRTGGQVNSGPAVSGGVVYVGSDDGKVYALDAATGAVEWTRPVDGKVDSSPAVSDGTVFVGSTGGEVYALDAATGAILWQRQTNGQVNSSPVVSGGMAYIGTDDDAVYALSTATGH